MIGSYLNYDFPAYLDVYLQQDLNITEDQYNMLYTVYSIPNVILPLFGGLFVDKIGVRWGIFLFSFILIIGQGICWLSVYADSPSKTYGIMIAGRVIFGFGGESLCVA